ncbi:uncharacterized protein LOC124284784 [Haliotis rubra]|uniref:uncharacterized protein LOC124284784 n=1 Tax=Haliotis rubra TaxID=36100 RepID=UPI001EE579C6|nr:uncharacterized protein LOC124284784 [Haliotis rubra]
MFSESKSSKKVNKPMTAAKPNGTKDKGEKNYAQEELTSNIDQDVSDQEVVKTLQDDDVQDVGEAQKNRTAQSDLAPVETVDPTPGCSKDFDHQPVAVLPTSPADYPKPMTVAPMPGCSKDPDNEQIPTSSRPPAEDDPQPGTSTEFEPTPGCSKDPDVPLRSFSKASRKSNLSTLSSKSTKSEPVPASDYVDPFFRRSRAPDLRPDLEDESLPPNRRTLVAEVPSSREEDEDPSKVNVDSDLMEMALFIHLAMMKRTRALREMIDAQ